MSVLRCRCGCVVPLVFQFDSRTGVCSKCEHSDMWHQESHERSVSTIASPRSSQHRKIGRNIAMHQMGYVTIVGPHDKRYVHFFNNDGPLIKAKVVVQALYTPIQSTVYSLIGLQDVDSEDIITCDQHREININRLRVKGEYNALVHDTREHELHELGFPRDMKITHVNMIKVNQPLFNDWLELFRVLDTHDRGWIGIDELKLHYKMLLEDPHCNQLICEKMLQQLDVSGDEHVDFREFMLAQARCHHNEERKEARQRHEKHIPAIILQKRQDAHKKRSKLAQTRNELALYRQRNPQKKPAHTKRGAHGSVQGGRNHSSSSSSHPHVLKKSTTLRIPKLVDEFKLIDDNGDGKISRVELRNLMVRLGEDPRAADTHARAFFRCTDVDQNGFVEFSEFTKEYGRMQLYHTVCFLKEEWEKYDRNEDATLTKRELYVALVDYMGVSQAKLQLRRIFDALDVDHSGYISLNELEYWHFDEHTAKHKKNVLRKFV